MQLYIDPPAFPRSHTTQLFPLSIDCIVHHLFSEFFLSLPIISIYACRLMICMYTNRLKLPVYIRSVYLTRGSGLTPCRAVVTSDTNLLEL